MDIRTSEHSDEPISQHLEVLRDYAKRVITDGERLSPGEETHRDLVFETITELGGSFRMTEREIVSLILRGVFLDAPPCWCSKCRESFLDVE